MSHYHETIKRILILVILFIISIVIISLVAGFVLAATNGSFTTVRMVSAIMEALILGCLYKIHTPSFGFIKKSLSLRVTAIAIMIGVLIWGLNCFNHLIFHDFNQDKPLKFLFFAVVYAPIMEELIFRHWIYSYLDKYHISKWCVLLTSATLFYLGHLSLFAESINWRLDSLLVGILLFFLYERTRDVRYCILAHAVANALGYFLI